MSREVRLRIVIDAPELMKMYRGEVREAIARDVHGRTVRFPAHILRPFVSAGGISGNFIIRYDENNRFKEIVRVG